MAYAGPFKIYWEPIEATPEQQARVEEGMWRIIVRMLTRLEMEEKEEATKPKK